MELPSLADILIVIILIIPGFITFYIITKISVIEQKFSDFETTIWSIFLSLFIYIPFSFLIGVSSIDAIRDDKMNVVEEKKWGKEIFFTEGDIKRIVFLEYLD